MKVLYISDRRTGGIVSHVKCLADCLPPEVERYVIGVGGDEEFAGKNGHDIREWFQIRRVIRTFKPDVIHFHIPNVMMALYVKFESLRVRKFKLVCSWHTPTNHPPSWGQKIFFWLLDKECYYLPVSTPTWEGLKKWLPRAKEEVFFNPIRIEESLKVRRFESLKVQPSNLQTLEPSNFIIGMVGRNADQKDWPSFHRVEEIVKESLKVREFESSKVQPSEPSSPQTFKPSNLQTFKPSNLQTFKPSNILFLNAGETEVCNGREAIAKMDLFVMTSKHEQLPTTVLECFMLGTPICGFIPVGGTTDILGFSKGPVREAFIAERSCEKLADIVLDLMQHPGKRQALVEDGRQILEHFDAEKNCKNQLMKVYESSKVRKFESLKV